MDSPKTLLTAYEAMVLLGNFDPKLSARLKAALDKQFLAPECQGLPPEQTFALASRKLALTCPEAFDPGNRDDQALKTLAPLCFTENGEREDFATIQERVDFHDLRIACNDLGDHALIEVVAKDVEGQSLRARFSVGMKKGRRRKR